VKLAEKLLFEEYINKQLKMEMMLKMYPEAVYLYMEHSPPPPTADEIIEQAQKFFEYINGSSNEI
jgi:hypothetical protein